MQNLELSIRERFWNAYAICYDSIWDSPITAEVADEIAAQMPAARFVVDLGCGTGLFSARFTCRDATVIGVDRSRGMLRRAIGRRRITSAAEFDVSRTELPERSADLVLCANLLHLHRSPHEVFAEALRLVRDGGLVAIVTPAVGISRSGIVGADLSSGRGVFGALVAHTLRSNFALVSGLARVRVRRPSEVIDLVHDAAYGSDLTMLIERIIGSTQHLMILEVPVLEGRRKTTDLRAVGGDHVDERGI